MPGREWFKAGLGQIEGPLVLGPDGGVEQAPIAVRLISADTGPSRAMSDRRETPALTKGVANRWRSCWGVKCPMPARSMGRSRSSQMARRAGRRPSLSPLSGGLRSSCVYFETHRHAARLPDR